MAQRNKRVRIRGARSAFPQQILLKVCRVRTKQMVFIHCSRRTGPRGRSGGAPRARMDQDGVTTHRQMPHFRPPAPQILRDRPSRSISAAIGLCGSAPSLASIRCSAPRVEMGVRIKGARSAFPQQILLKVCRVRTKQMVFIHCSRRTGPRGRSGGAPRARMDQDGVTTHRQMPHFRPPAPQILRDRPSRSISAAIGLCGSAPSLASIRCSAPRVEMGVASGLGEDRGIESRSVRRMLPRLPRAQIQRRAGRPAQRAPGPAQRAAAGGRRGRRCTAILTCT